MRTSFGKAALRVLQALAGPAFLFVGLSACAQGNAGDNYSLRKESNAPGAAQLVNLVSTGELGNTPPIRQEAYRIGPDDLLDISVFEAPEMNRTLRVSADGEVSFELLGAVNASGLTPEELETVLQDLLRSKFMKDPHVGVFVHELESHPVSVVGAVKKSGVFQIRGTKTLIELISMAEGLADDAGDTVLIMRGGKFALQTQTRNGGVEQVNLRDLMESKDLALNVPIYPGDIVKVTTAGIVYVVGEVHKPGGFVLKNNQNISLLQALALAEGLTHTAATNQARIVRTDPTTGNRIEIPANLGKILANKKMDLELQPQDILFIPNSSAKSAFYRAAEAAISTASGVAIYKW